MNHPLKLFGNVLSDGRETRDCLIELTAAGIVSVAQQAPPEDGCLVVTDGWIAPGLVDLQVNGVGGIDFTSALNPADALKDAALVLARHGVTAFCPTVVSSSLTVTLQRLAAFGPARFPDKAECLGAHLEGPFLNTARRGAHDPSRLRSGTRAEIQRWNYAGMSTLVTLAPELPGALDLIRNLRTNGVTVALGHSDASPSEAREALNAGASIGTHLFNAMPPLHHRNPGLVGALLISQATLTLIADGVHLDPAIIEVAIRVAGVDRVGLISDCVASAGAPAGEYHLGEAALRSSGTQVRTSTGAVAGANVLLDACLRNARGWFPWLSAAELVKMATQTPAAAIGLSHRKGKVAVGYDADLVILSPDFRVVRTIVAGRVLSPSGSGTIPGVHP